MVTLKTADNVLKDFYLDAVTEHLNNKVNPFLARIKRTETGVSGKDVKVVCHTGISGGFIAGAETDDLPTGGDSSYVVMKESLKNLYGTIEISDKAIRASAKDEGALVNLLEKEMENLVKSATVNFGRMLFGNGSGKLTDVKACQDGILIVQDTRNIFEGMYIDVVLDDVAYEKLKIVNIDRANKQVYIESGLPDAATKVEPMYLHKSKYKELHGLKSIFEDNILYGLGRDKNFMRPNELIYDDYIDERLVMKMMDEVEIASGRKVDYIICSHGVKRSFVRILGEQGISLPTMKLENGDIALDFHGIPIVADRFCPEGEMYLLTTDCFKLCQLCDWQWLEAEDGKILKQIAGKPAYTATLVKYAELICELPSAQARITGLLED